MKRIAWTQKVLAMLCGLLLATVFAVPAALAAGGTCSLRIEFLDGSAPLAGATFRVYRVAELADFGEYNLLDAFKSSGAELRSQMTNRAWEEAAAKLSAHASRNGLKADLSGVTDTNGALSFSGLEEGVYLVEGDPLQVGDDLYTPQTFCVVLPGRDADGPVRDLTVTPKFRKYNGSPEKTETDPGDKKPVVVGQKITYEITWANYLAQAAKVTITDPLDKGVDFVSASEPGRYDRATHTVTWELGEQEAGASGSVTLTVQVNASAQTAGQVKNQATVAVGNRSKQTNTPENPVPTPTPSPSPLPSHSPQTGDSGQPGLWLAILSLSLLGLAATALSWRRRTGPHSERRR